MTDSLAVLVFWLAAGVIVYAWAGYPVLLVLLARLRPAPSIAKGEVDSTLSLVVVVHDEEQRIASKLDGLLALETGGRPLEVVIVSDGSTDRTEAIVSSYGDRGVRLVRREGPRGKACALAAVVPGCQGGIVILTDVRQRFDPDAIVRLVECFADPTVGAVSGELMLETEDGATAGVGAYWRYEKKIRELESRTGSVVGVTGAIYAVRRELFPKLDPETILDDVAVPMNVVREGQRVLFEPAARAWDRLPDDPDKEYRRKVRTLAGNYQLLALEPWLLSPLANPVFFRLVSHKLLRLVVPWCLLLCLIASGLLMLSPEAWFFRLAFSSQAGFYGLAALASARRRSGREAGRLALPYSFVLLNLAAATSLFRWLAGRERAAWAAKG